LECAQRGLGDYLSRALAQGTGAWHIAQPAIKTARKLQHAGQQSGARRRGPTSKAHRIIEEAERLAAKGRDPWRNIARIANRTSSTPEWVRRTLKSKISRD
jgi:hypothetical protein